MARHRVVDLRRVLPLSFGPSSTEGRDATWLCLVVESLTACGVGSRWQKSSARCEDARCQGVLALRRTGDACEWYCSRCTASGAIVGFRGSVHDLSRFAGHDLTPRSDAVVYTRSDELEALRRQRMSQSLRFVLALARLHPQGFITIALTDEELALLTRALEQALPRAHDDDLLALHRLQARLDAVTLLLSTREQLPVTLH